MDMTQAPLMHAQSPWIMGVADPLVGGCGRFIGLADVAGY